MAFDRFIITRAGRELLGAAAISGDIVFTRGALGRGALAAGADLTLCTCMADAVADMSVGAPVLDGDVVRVSCQFTNGGGGAGYLPEFRWNEAGLFARLGSGGDEVLLAYANTCDPMGGDVIPGTACEFEVVFALCFDGAGEAAFGTEGLIFATLTDLERGLAGKAALMHTHRADEVTAGVLGGMVVASDAAVAALGSRQVRNVIISATAPSGAADGDIWLSYT